MQTLASLILHGLLCSIPFLCSPLRTRLHSHFAHDRARAAFGGMSSALIEKIIVFDDKIRIFFKYTKTSPEDNPWEMSAYPGSDSSNMVDLRRVLRATCYSQLLSRSARCARAAFGGVNCGMASPCCAVTRQVPTKKKGGGGADKSQPRPPFGGPAQS